MQTSNGAVVWDSGTGGPATDSVTVPGGDLTYDTGYSWEVRYQNSQGLWSSYSTATTFTTLSLPVNVPVNASPASGAEGISLTPTLSASAFSGSTGVTQLASEWVVTQVSNNTVVWDSGAGGAATDSVVVPTGDLAYNTTYSWQVRYEGTGPYWSGYSTATTFTTLANIPPSTPTNVAPTNGATGVSLTPALQASAFSDSIGNTQAASEWVLTRVSNGTVVWDSGTDTSATNSVTVPSALAYDTEYSWKVRYENGLGLWSSYSSATTFTTVTIPNTPVNVSPANAATGITLRPTLVASAFSDAAATQAASEWVVTLSDSTVVWDSGRDTTDTDSTTVPAGKLTFTTGYFWKVRYENSGGISSAASTATTFTTMANVSPNTPVNATPANGATLLPLTTALTTTPSAMRPKIRRRPASGL